MICKKHKLFHAKKDCPTCGSRVQANEVVCEICGDEKGCFFCNKETENL